MNLRILHDLSPIVREGMPVWPGDTPYTRKLTWSMADGASVNVSALHTTPHLGSHADAPFHTERAGATIDAMPLAAYLGPCRVVRVAPVDLLEPEHLTHLGDGWAQPPRLLLASGSVPDRTRFPERCSAISPRLARALGNAGVLLVGLDSPSVDPLDSKTMEAHHALNRGGVAYLEGLVLDGVPEAEYLLVALPLRLEGLDASPVRAVLCAWPPDGVS